LGKKQFIFRLALNDGNEYLHYTDDWYVPGYKEGEYVFVYYRAGPYTPPLLSST
jgi:hypothetical protein